MQGEPDGERVSYKIETNPRGIMYAVESLVLMRPHRSHLARRLGCRKAAGKVMGQGYRARAVVSAINGMIAHSMDCRIRHVDLPLSRLFHSEVSRVAYKNAAVGLLQLPNNPFRQMGQKLQPSRGDKFLSRSNYTRPRFVIVVTDEMPAGVDQWPIELRVP
jgi:hypothetical protein